MSLTKLAQEIETLEKTLAEKRGELLRALGGSTVIDLSKPVRAAPKKAVRASKVVKGPSISERTRSELSKRPAGISFTDLCQLPSLSGENKASIKSVLKKDRKDGEVWFDGEVYGLGEKPKKPAPAQKKTPRPVKAGGSGEMAVQAPIS